MKKLLLACALCFVSFTAMADDAPVPELKMRNAGRWYITEGNQIGCGRYGCAEIPSGSAVYRAAEAELYAVFYGREQVWLGLPSGSDFKSLKPVICHPHINMLHVEISCEYFAQWGTEERKQQEASEEARLAAYYSAHDKAVEAARLSDIEHEKNLCRYKPDHRDCPR